MPETCIRVRGFRTTPLNLVSGFARITPSGRRRTVGCDGGQRTRGDGARAQLRAGAEFHGGIGFLYFAVQRERRQRGRRVLAAVETARPLAQQTCGPLFDPHTGGAADLTDFRPPRPTIGPDGQVFYGVLDAGLNNNDRAGCLSASQTLAPLRCDLAPTSDRRCTTAHTQSPCFA